MISNPSPTAYASFIDASPYLSRLADLHGEPSGNTDLDRLIRDIYEQKNTLTPEDLIAHKGVFTLAWAEAALNERLAFEELGRLQSRFSDATIDAALFMAWREVLTKSRIKSIPENVVGLFVLGLGKLGGFDLNFSSDVDLIAFFDPETLPVPKHMGQAYIVDQILKRMTQILKPRGAIDFVWRVDWRLRPDASASLFARSVQSAQDYYFFKALPWHRLALMKARTVAGDIESGKDFLAIVAAFIWRQNLDFRALDELAYLKTRVNLEHPGLRLERKNDDRISENPEGFNLKLGTGGIREIEFFTNGQQLVWGGKHYELRTSHTLSALNALVTLGHVNADTAARMSKAYMFFRRSENAAQMLENQQTHLVPTEADSRDRFMALLQIDDWAEYSKTIFEARTFVNTIFKSLFSAPDTHDTTAPTPLPQDVTARLGQLEDNTQHIINVWRDGFREYGVKNGLSPTYQSLALRLITQVTELSTDMDAAVVRIDRFFLALSRSEQYFDLLARHPDLLNPLLRPLLHSPPMAILLEQSPHIIDAYITQSSVHNTDFILQDPDTEVRLERLRRYVNENLYKTYYRFLTDDMGISDFTAELTEIAEQTLCAALNIVRDDLELDDIPISVQALGKLGARRMPPVSDLDLIFIFDDTVDSALAAKIVRRLKTALTVPLREGIAYELDMRLRPSGRSGPPAVMLNSFKDYHETRAKNWEHLALFSARHVAGDLALGDKVEAVRNEILSRPRSTEQLHCDAAVMWQRVANQRQVDPGPSFLNTKLRPGGLMQAEYLKSYYQLSGQNSDHIDAPLLHLTHLLCWERLLGLTQKDISHVPNVFVDAFCKVAPNGKCLADVEQYFAKIYADIQAETDRVLSPQHCPSPYTEHRIEWADDTPKIGQSK